MQHNHAFYLTLGYSLSALIILLEITSLWLAARKRKHAAQHRDQL